MTPYPETSPPSSAAMPGQSSESTGWSWLLAVLVGLMALVWLGRGRRFEPSWVDEFSFIAQGFYADLLLAGNRDDAAWIAFPAVDQPPLEKYLVGLSLRAGGHARPGLEAAQAWIQNSNLKIGTPGMLWAARWPSVILGALGCVAIFFLGTALRDRRAGVLAAVLLMIDPLYVQQSRRAVGDAACESLIMGSTVLSLWAWRRTLSGRIGAASGISVALTPACWRGWRAWPSSTGWSP